MRGIVKFIFSVAFQFNVSVTRASLTRLRVAAPATKREAPQLESRIRTPPPPASLTLTGQDFGR